MSELKQKIFYHICKILGVKEGENNPAWLGWLFFPLLSFYLKQSTIQYNPANDVFTLYGIRFSGAMFRAWARDGLPENVFFRMVKSEKNIMVIDRIIITNDN